MVRPNRSTWFRSLAQWAAIVAVCTAIAWGLYVLLRPSLPLPALESDPIFEPGGGGLGTQLRSDLRDAHVVVPARPHPLPFRPLDSDYTEAITKRAIFNCSTNSERFRGVHEYAAEPAEGVIRIAAVGDSITFGHGVGDHLTYPHRLELRLGEGFEVINAGVPGQDSRRALAGLEARVLPLRPHIVIVCIGVNEMSNLPERIDPTRMQLWLSEELYAKVEREFADNLRAMEQACSEAGVHLVLLVPPVNSFSPFPDAIRFCRGAREVAQQNGIAMLDLQREFHAIEQQDGLELIHMDESQSVVAYRKGRADELLSVRVSPQRQQYISDRVYRFLDEEDVAMKLSLDGSHPNVIGLELIAEMVEPVILELVQGDPALQAIHP